MFLQKLMVYVSALFMFVYMIGLHLTLRILHLIAPGFTKKVILKMGESITMTQNPRFRYEDWGLTFMSFTFIKTGARNTWQSLGQEAFLGGAAPDSPVAVYFSMCNFTISVPQTSYCVSV
uniref:Iodothyronine deiodinase n=1 Tax=Gouania willdenowi TaxID=441366 RepID=A0A8C5D7D7_GOUWI